MPSSISAFEGTCVSIPCRFSFPDELRPAVVHGVWYFNSPYPKNYPPVVFKSRTQVVHESFQGRSRLLGDLGLRNCTLLLSNLSPELGGKYYFRGDLGGYNQYTFSEHSVLDIISESRGLCLGRGAWERGSPPSALLGRFGRQNQGLAGLAGGRGANPPAHMTRQMTERGKAGPQVVLSSPEESSAVTLQRHMGERQWGSGVAVKPLHPSISWATVGSLLKFSGPCYPLL